MLGYLLYNVSDVNSCYNEIALQLKVIYENNFSFTRLSRHVYKDTKWGSQGLILAASTNAIFTKYQLSTDSEYDKLKYTSYTNILKELLWKAEIMYFKNLWDSRVNNIKCIWFKLLYNY